MNFMSIYILIRARLNDYFRTIIFCFLHYDHSRLKRTKRTISKMSFMILSVANEIIQYMNAADVVISIIF